MKELSVSNMEREYTSGSKSNSHNRDPKFTSYVADRLPTPAGAAGLGLPAMSPLQPSPLPLLS